MSVLQLVDLIFMTSLAKVSFWGDYIHEKNAIIMQLFSAVVDCVLIKEIIHVPQHAATYIGQQHVILLCPIIEIAQNSRVIIHFISH